MIFINTKKRIEILILIFFIFSGCLSSKRTYSTVNVEDVKKSIDLNDGSFIIIDVRTPEEYRGELGHIKESKLMPLDKLEELLPLIIDKKHLKVYVICRSGNRSRTASQILINAGFEKVFNVSGGMIEWNQKGYPVER